MVDGDPGDSISFTLVAAPVGMTMAASGRLNWLPEVEGSFQVSIIASDTIGFATPQSYTLVVGQPVVVPDVVGQPQTNAESTLSNANLLTGSVRTATHPTIAAGSVFEQTPIAGSVAEFGGKVDLRVSTGAAPEDTDDDGDGLSENQGDCNDADATIGPGQADPPGDGIDQDCDGVDGNLVLTELLVSPASSTVLVNQAVSLTATGIFEDGTSQNLTGVVSWNNGPSFSSSAAGTFTSTASRDGIDGTATISVVSRSIGDTTPPVAAITAPAKNSTVTESIDVIGAASDANFLRYELAYAPAGETSFTKIVSSTVPVANGLLGRFDPTLLLNDLYTIRITVFDSGGNQSIEETLVQVDGNLKVGNFTVGFNDLVVPVGKIPIQIGRTYDSRDKGKGEFGVGWRLDVRSLRVRTSGVLGNGWRVDRSGLAFGLVETDAHRVSVTLADGTVEEFDMVVTPRVSPLIPFPPSANRVRFAARLGTRGTLESLNNNNLTIVAPQPGEIQLLDDNTLKTYDPDLWRYTSPDGTAVVVSKSNGVQSIADLNGNILTFSRTGIAHSSGVGITFVLDDQDRISEIIDPAGISQQYIYDANGDLRQHVDRDGASTRFKYNQNHGLIEILDPLNRPLARNEYDDSGRLIAVTNDQGNRVEFDRDIAARVERILNPAGGTTTAIYDSRGNVVSETDETGRPTTRTYDANDRLLTETNAMGGTSTFEYDSLGRLVSRTDSRGSATNYTFDDHDRMTSLTRPDGSVSTFKYDSRGNLSSETNATGGSRFYSYSASGLRSSVTFENGALVRFNYDARGNLIATENSAGVRGIFEYDVNGNETRAGVQTANGLVSISRNYDNSGRLLRVTDTNGSAVNFTLDATGNPVAVVDRRGNLTEQSFDVSSRLIEKKFPDGRTEVRNYTARGQLLRLEDRAGRNTRYVYDAAGRPLEMILPDATSDTNDNDRVAVQYNALGLPSAISDSGGETITLAHDSGGRLIGVNNPVVGPLSFSFDINGHDASQVDALGNTTSYERDVLGRITATTLPDGSRHTRSYDAVGNLTESVDAAGNVTRYTYDLLSRLIGVTQPTGDVTSFAYDERDNLIRQIDANGNVTQYTYDSEGRRTSITRPQGEVATLSYDAAGNVIRATNFSGEVAEMIYNNLNQLVEKRFPDGSTVSFTYKPGGERASYTNSLGTTRYAYDEQGRIIRVDQPGSAFIAYAYDSNGNLAEIRTPAQTAQYVYSSNGRALTIIDGNGDVYRQTFNAAGNLVETERPNGLREIRTYDALQQVAAVASIGSAGQTISRYEYSYLTDGNIGSVTELDGRVSTYEYDANGRLIREVYGDGLSIDREITYSYDAVGNRLTRLDSMVGLTTYTYDRNDRLLEATTGSVTARYAYDANGNVISRTSPTQSTIFTWDFENRLRSVSRSGLSTVAYSYDPEGIRTTSTTGTSVTRYISDTNRQFSQIAEEIHANGSSTPFLLARREPLALGSGANRLQLLSDAHSGVRQVADSVASITTTYDYDGYGRTLSATGDTDASRLNYRSEVFDDAAGAYYLRARYYDPDVGRFLSTDPFLGDAASPISLHRYLYANDNPIAFSDPSGEMTLGEVAVSIGIYGGLLAIPTVIAGSYYRTLSGEFSWTGPAGVVALDPSLFGGGAGPALGASLYAGTSECFQPGVGVAPQKRTYLWASIFGGVGAGYNPVALTAGPTTMYSPKWIGQSSFALTGGTVMAAGGLGFGFGANGSIWLSGLSSNLKKNDPSNILDKPVKYLTDPIADKGDAAITVDASVSLLGGLTIPVWWWEPEACLPSELGPK